MTKAEIIKRNIENVNDKYNTSFGVKILNHKNYDAVLVTKEDDSCFTIEDIISRVIISHTRCGGRFH